MREDRGGRVKKPTRNTRLGIMKAVPPFPEFLDRYRASVYRFLLVAVGPGEVDDCFQETFLAALRAYPTLHDGERLDRWILRIASRKAIDHHRAGRRRPIVLDTVPETTGPAENAAEASILDRDDPLWQAVGDLPPRQRVAIVHRHVMDRSYAEIAELMGIGEDAVRANVYQGLKRLREVIV
jgi:RNA polymerase sigma factor (sigma-70 family)